MHTIAILPSVELQRKLPLNDKSDHEKGSALERMMFVNARYVFYLPFLQYWLRPDDQTMA